MERCIGKRLAATGCHDLGEYLACLRQDGPELDRLIDLITVNVSWFFRDSLTFELIADRILPAMVREKARTGDPSLRVWSAGCARGEEPYSMAILIHDLLEREGRRIDLHLLATDIDAGALEDAKEALYPPSALEQVKHRLLVKYFTQEGASFRLIPEIRDMVRFSRYDMLDRKHAVPPDSVFGDFDLVLCRNLLIYFNPEYKARILERLHAALAWNGCLVLGEAEAPDMALKHHFNRVFEFGPIYRKRQEGKKRR